ncbi:MAG: metal-dependent hydrolase [Actinobacteria bacterium]|nr:metal-dependent hydrolase [Actinomycetota bacterium]
MSWAAHELENYFIVKHTKTRVSFLAVALGAFAPDLITKGFVYGFSVGPLKIAPPDNPVQFHRGWPGVGFTHSLMFGVVVAILVLAITRNRSWALGLLIGHAAHVLTDINDTAGTMLFFPFSLENVTTNMWKHAAYAGRYGDAAAYYGSLGGVWDAFWLVMVVGFARNTLKRDYFRNVIVPADPKVWSWLNRRLGITERGLLALYRGLLFYGACRIVSWSLYTHLVVKADWDPVWAGPGYIKQVSLADGSLAEQLAQAALGAVAFAVFLLLVWKLFVRRLWDRGYDPPVLEHAGVEAAPA